LRKGATLIVTFPVVAEEEDEDEDEYGYLAPALKEDCR
jgi:hypothetical protein